MNQKKSDIQLAIEDLATRLGITPEQLLLELDGLPSEADDQTDALTCTRKLPPRFLAEVASLPGRLFTAFHWWRKHPR